MVGITDGLGGEEVNQEVTITETISGTNVYATTTVSGLDVRAAGSVVAKRINDSNDALFSISHGSPGNFGAVVQTGSLGTAAGSTGFIALRQAYSNTDYAVFLFPFSGGSIAGHASGVQNAASGVNVVGGPSNRYYWLAVGR